MNEIKIYQLDHKTVVAEQNGVSASARCHPEDAFDFAVGAKLAFERLYELITPKFKKGDKVICNGQVGVVTYVFKKRSKIRVKFSKYEEILCDVESVKHFEFQPYLLSSMGQHFGVIGTETDFTDLNGVKFHVGDIVAFKYQGYDKVIQDYAYVGYTKEEGFFIVGLSAGKIRQGKGLMKNSGADITVYLRRRYTDLFHECQIGYTFAILEDD